MVRSYLGKPSEAVYTLENMADDAAALLDHLRIEKAHIVGGSMGGMIAQVFAARYQHRTKTLAVIFSSNNQALLPPPGPKQLRAITTRPKDTSRDGVIANAVRVSRIIGSPGYPAPEEKVLADAVEGYDRSYYPAGVARHFSAIMGSGSLLHYDKQITAPTVVIHGRADKLMRPSRRTRRRKGHPAVPGWCSSTAWPTTFPSRCGTTSSANSRPRLLKFREQARLRPIRDAMPRRVASDSECSTARGSHRSIPARR